MRIIRVYKLRTYKRGLSAVLANGPAATKVNRWPAVTYALALCGSLLGSWTLCLLFIQCFQQCRNIDVVYAAALNVRNCAVFAALPQKILGQASGLAGFRNLLEWDRGHLLLSFDFANQHFIISFTLFCDIITILHTPYFVNPIFNIFANTLMFSILFLRLCNSRAIIGSTKN